MMRGWGLLALVAGGSFGVAPSTTSGDGGADGADGASSSTPTPGGWCAAQGPHTLCTDFDDEPAPAWPRFGWPDSHVRGSSTLALDATALSPARALRAAAGDDYAQLSMPGPGFVSRFHFAFRLETDPLCANSSLHIVRYACSSTGTSPVTLKVKAGLIELDLNGGPSGTLGPLLEAGRWYRLVGSLDRSAGASAHIEVQLFGQEGADPLDSRSYDFTFDTSCPLRSFDVGPWVSGGGACTMLLDNLWVDVE